MVVGYEWDDALAEGFFLQISWDTARVNDQAINFDEPRQWISGKLTGKRPARIELADLQKFENCP
ncbi:hypothetical protein BURMUCGD2M_6374 [Burkholderia multivorans CGD2M]|uniref:Uncharacterized protein n=1 Tax=Burkholderia multivorans CGD2 TaxID=513052 RepID=B9BNW5_9BURK|nr:hypothetical protein BURMUCGD2_6385 [Burkholderia multivorans CGD2]EEE13653.1 hypothetical protein BURMUCGD2M_6374 [Burkholderia multivorans CGD2M]PRE03405.1 hypothetical protein C6P91_19640 [Burkholderia multivorans]PRE08889.1 hypothetical protein C6P78_30600 [Burkholderia multivorans]PRH20202.1 hypothetical protein C6T53_22310 [Burkholderia multivorans]